MNELGLKELQKIQLDILSEVSAFCTDNNLSYSLAYGTLLGAVRHKGFIPWDDDIDIWMPRTDYEKFRKIFRSERYYLVDSVSGVELPFGKVCDGWTELLENANHSVSTGVFIDVFPVDYLPENIQKKKSVKRIIKLLYYIKSVKEVRINKNRSFIKNLVLISLKVLTLTLSYRQCIKLLTNKMQKTKVDEAYCLTDYNDYKKEIHISMDTFTKLVKLPFEDKNFTCVNCFDDVLKDSYGDYMILPPIEKRETHHAYKARYNN